MINRCLLLTVCTLFTLLASQPATGELLAGAARIDVTHPDQPFNDRLYARALVLLSGDARTAIVSIDVVALEEIGPIKTGFMKTVRAAVRSEIGIAGENIVVNASHCHGTVCSDIAKRTIAAIREANAKMEPVLVGVGSGREDRIMENRRLLMKDGTEIDVRRAYAMPPDDQVAAVGPVDPEIGVLKLQRIDGTTLAVVYNFACHPIIGVPSRLNTADLTGYSSQVIEENLSDGAVALFVQGCAGDINPIRYKEVSTPRHAQTLGNQLGLSTLKAIRALKVKRDDRLVLRRAILSLPRADVASKIQDLEIEQLQLARSLRGTSLNHKTFMELLLKHKLSPGFPTYYSHGYLHEEAIGSSNLKSLDQENRKLVRDYMQNIQTMEKLTRLNTNLALLKMHQQRHLNAEQRTIDVELVAMRVGEFVLTTFPGELTVQIGLNIKKRSPHANTFVAGYTNGYIYYAPTTTQLKNRGHAQEDSDCILADDWQAKYETKALEMLMEL